jgi:hypothetical protein
MTGNNETKFVSRRTEALAMVLLTSRPDLTVMSPPANAGIDLIVSIVQKKVHSFNHFGVILKGTSQEIHTARLASKVLKSLDSWKATSASLTMPVCVFFCDKAQTSNPIARMSARALLCVTTPGRIR